MRIEDEEVVEEGEKKRLLRWAYMFEKFKKERQKI